MPNFWTRTVQKIEESIDGPRTCDQDLINNIDTMNNVQKAMTNLNSILTNFPSIFEKIMSYNRELSECVFLIFNRNNEYKEFADVLTAVHVDNNTLFQDIVNDISKLSKETIKWNSYYSDVKNYIKERDDARKVYDHYEKKLEKLENKKDFKINEGTYQVGSNFYKEVTRNEEKYISAKDDYVLKATKTYEFIENLNNNRFNVITPVLLNLFLIETKIYESFSTKYYKYKDIHQKLYKMKNDFLKKEINKTYDPLIHTKCANLEQKFDITKLSAEPNLSARDFKNQNRLSFISKKSIKDFVNCKSFVAQGKLIEEVKKPELRDDTHYMKRSTKLLEQIYGDFDLNEFCKIDNQFSTENDTDNPHNPFIMTNLDVFFRNKTEIKDLIDEGTNNNLNTISKNLNDDTSQKSQKLIEDLYFNPSFHGSKIEDNLSESVNDERTNLVKTGYITSDNDKN